jgi:2-polyprenyl-3-methyl-5-hydroxy-6-metoxy-1,4-benzoquinol methylase
VNKLLEWQTEPLLEYVACALCKNDNTELLFGLSREGKQLIEAWPPGVIFKLVRCRECGLAYVNPRISQGTSDHVYSLEQELTYFQQTYQARSNSYRTLIHQANQWLDTHQASLLDVGCGDGALLKVAAERGIKVTGTEASKALSRIVSQELGPKTIWHGELNELEHQSFDIISLINVLEHVHHPDKLLEDIAGLVKVGGIVLIHVPNFGGVPARLRGSKWHHLEPLEHLYYFTFGTLTKFLMLFDLKPIDRFNLIINKGSFASMQRLLGLLDIYMDNGLGIVAQRQS